MSPLKPTPTAPKAPQTREETRDAQGLSQTGNAAKFDFTALTPVEAEQPKQARTARSANSPFVGWMRESRESGKGKSITLPEAQVKEAVYLIRAAANVLNSEPYGTGCGARIGAPIKNPDGTVTLVFAAKDRRKYTPKEEQ